MPRSNQQFISTYTSLQINRSANDNNDFVPRDSSVLAKGSIYSRGSVNRYTRVLTAMICFELILFQLAFCYFELAYLNVKLEQSNI